MKSRSRKPLSPVVASIILIAVTVAVSIAVAAWMGALTLSFMRYPSPSGIGISVDFIEPHTINVTLSNAGSSAIYPDSLLINNVIVHAKFGHYFTWPVVVVNNLPIGSSYRSLIDYNWTYHTVYTVTLVSWNSNNDGSEDTSKQYNFSTSFTSPFKIESMVLPIPEFNNANCAVWEYQPHYQGFPLRSNITLLPANMTIDTTAMPNGSAVTISIYYYQLQSQSLFEYLGEKDYLLIVKEDS